LVSKPRFILGLDFEPKHDPKPNTITQKEPIQPCNRPSAKMGSSMTLEERLEAIMKNCEHLQARNEEKANQNEHLRRQLGHSLRQKRRERRSSSSSRPPGSAQGEEEEEGPLSGGSQSEGDSPRHPRRERRHTSNSNNFKVNLPKFEGKLDPNDFLELMQTVERIFEYKEVPKDKKVKLVALKLRKMHHYGGLTC